jgi:membrane fusion protein (multidrug efflux system)
VFPNPDRTLLPGMFVHARLVEGTRKDALLVPQQGVTRDSTGAAQVWVVGQDGKATLQPIQVDRTVGNTWLVTSGLRAQDRVVTEGLQRLQPGVTVSPKPATNVRIETDERSGLPSAALAAASDSHGS